MDTHSHTSYSYDVPDVPETAPENIVQRQLDLGLLPVITDHDTLSGYIEARKKNKYVISGVEIRIKPLKARHVDCKNLHTLHINVLGLNRRQYAVLDRIANEERDLDMFVDFLRNQRLKWTYNHPFWHEKREKLIWKAIPDLANHYFDVIELNASMTKQMNDLTLHIADTLGKGIVASSDSHNGRPGIVYTLAKGRNFSEFWENVKKGDSYIVRSDLNAISAVVESSHMIRNIFRANTDPAPLQRFRPAIGIRAIDRMATIVTSGWLKNRSIIKRALQMIAMTLNYSAGPLLTWRLYVKKNDAVIARVKRRMELLLNARKKDMKISPTLMLSDVKANKKRLI